ncbi:serine/threonine protein kinase [Ancylothrix sp. C2]|uniref:serine/threonine-protein kinase n=1 Tax=Ancylothrix sp. D3o TaxID=2953691 RepID=UPI0021BB7A58|nr:serine/threonine-protein kinase [Ancylothrix sp. D3o]MCT7952667.1 serine/threonine protein kinase [Ancylothrix sp. D3o]
MSLCINPTCPQPNHPQNGFNRYCEKCGSDLLLEKRYRVLRLLNNNSGFGDIYEAYETGSTKILKVLKQNHNNNAKAVELFQKEAEVLGQLNHPGIPKVEGYYQHLTKNGGLVHCIVMEKIEGLNLEEWLQQQGNKGINQELAIKWLKELAEILQLVHEKEFFHRDIKPPNIMIRSDGRLVLIDFGTARQATYTYLAKVGMRGGITAVISAGYTPPEQQNGQAVPQSDFFALGRTFVHLLTGRYPLKFYDPNKDNLLWRDHVSGVSSVLLNFIDELMAAKPSQRPLNAQVLLERIGEIECKLTPVVKPPVTKPQQRRNLLDFFAGTLSNLQIGNVIRTLSGHSLGVNSVAISPDGHTIVSGSCDKTIKIWNLQTGNVIRTLSGHSDWVDSVAISPDGQTLVSGSKDKTIKIWNLQTGNVIRTLSSYFIGHSDSVNSVAISPDGQTLFSGSADSTIKIWNLQTGNLIRTIPAHYNGVNCVAISPDGQTLFSGNGSADSTIKIWNLQTGDLIRTLSGHSYWVYSVAISPDGQTLVSSSDDKTIKIWNLQTGNLIRTLSGYFVGHSDSVDSVAISPDGQTLVSGSKDKTIKIWNLQTGNLIRTLSSHSDWVDSVAISPDGQTLVSGSNDATIKIWRLK